MVLWSVQGTIKPHSSAFFMEAGNQMSWLYHLVWKEHWLNVCLMPYVARILVNLDWCSFTEWSSNLISASCDVFLMELARVVLAVMRVFTTITISWHLVQLE